MADFKLTKKRENLLSKAVKQALPAGYNENLIEWFNDTEDDNHYHWNFKYFNYKYTILIDKENNKTSSTKYCQGGTNDR